MKHLEEITETEIRNQDPNAWGKKFLLGLALGLGGLSAGLAGVEYLRGSPEPFKSVGHILQPYRDIKTATFYSSYEEYWAGQKHKRSNYNR